MRTAIVTLLGFTLLACNSTPPKTPGDDPNVQGHPSFSASAPLGSPCTGDTDCRVSDNCCDCAAVSKTAQVSDCKVASCLANICESKYPTSNVVAICKEGTCVVNAKPK